MAERSRSYGWADPEVFVDAAQRARPGIDVMRAMAAGEQELRAGAACRTVYEAVRDIFAQAGVAEHFPHHAGHGLGLTHPEAPYFVRQANEMLRANDVVTLEPGLYVPGVGGIRIEHNYRVTETGFERLSNHTIALK